MSGPWEKYAAAKPAEASAPEGDGPWAKYAKPAAAAPAPAGDAVGAAVEGFGQGASMGYLPQLQAGAYKAGQLLMKGPELMESAARKVAGKISGQDMRSFDEKFRDEGGTLNDSPETYVQLRDENIKRQEALAKSNPYLYHGSQVAGAIATAPAVTKVVGAAAARVAPAVMATGTRAAATTGAAIGAMQNPGDKEGEIAPLQLGQRAVNAGVGAALGAGLDKVASGAGKAIKKVASAATGIDEGAIETYLTNRKGVDEMIAKYGDNIADASDAVKKRWNSAVEVKKAALSAQKNQILTANEDKVVSAKPILEQLERAKSAIDPDLYPEAHGAIQRLQDKITKSLTRLSMGDKLAGATPVPEGSPAQLEKIKQLLQDEASSAYQKGGQIFAGGDHVSRAAKAAAAVARKQVNAAVPEVAGVNNEYQLLFDTQAKFNRNMLKEGASEAAILAAGGGSNQRNAKALARLGSQVGHNMLADAKVLAAQKAFANPALLPADTTGKAMARLAAGSAAGGAVGGVPGMVAGAVLTSPAALKQGLRVAGAARPVTNAIGRALGSPGTQAVAEELGANGVGAISRRKAFEGGVRPALERAGGAARGAEAEQPLKGEKKWANDGFEKLKASGRDPASFDNLKERIMADPEGRRLLINASDLKPGSPALAKILEKLKERYGAPDSRR